VEKENGTDDITLAVYTDNNFFKKKKKKKKKKEKKKERQTPSWKISY